MKTIYLSYILYLCVSFMGKANPQEEPKAILMDDISLQESEGLIKAHLIDGQKRKDDLKDMTLIGQARSISLPSQKEAQVVQVIWTGVKRKGKKQALFKEPLISTFKSEKRILSKGLKISLCGNKDQIPDALLRLEKAEDELLNELRADNPSSNERRLDSLAGSKKRRTYSKEPLNLRSTIEDSYSQNNTSLSSYSDRYGENPSPFEGEGKKADSLIRSSANSHNKLSRSSSNRAHTRDRFDPLKVKQNESSNSSEFKTPSIEVEVTKEGCTPRVDLERGKVIIQTRSIAKTDGKITHETQCTDSFMIFDIKKDYGCCDDDIDELNGVAYTRFKRYWLDETRNKIYLDEQGLKDETQPHPFIEEKGLCPHNIDLHSRLAYPQAQTFYYDRSNARKLIKDCHPVNGQALPITLTEQGCSLKHKFEKNKSIVQKRDIFIENGVIHEVTPCHETNEKIAHHFIKAGCKPVINGSTVIPMAKRQISYKDKTKFISHQCEPQDLTNLLSSQEGCEGLYEHDYESGRSYPLVRYYYQWGGKNRFIDKLCRRSNEPLPHFLSIVGYEHLDEKLQSKPRYQVSIKNEQKVVILKEFTEQEENKKLPYVLSSEIDKPSLTKAAYMDGNSLISPQDKVQIWTRPDETIYEKVVGLSKPIIQDLPKPSAPSQTTIIKNSNTLVQSKPTRTVIQVTHEYAQVPYQVAVKGSAKKLTYHYPGVRDITHYSNGTKEFGPWRKDVK